VDCLSYGVRVELVPWAEGRNHLTKSDVRAQAQPGPALHLLRYVEGLPARRRQEGRSVRAKEARLLYARGLQPFLTRTRRLRLERACGFRTYRAVEVAPFQDLGRLPEPDLTHRFC